MKKDFDRWNTQKKKLNDQSAILFYKEREVWWCSLGVNIGFEQDGKGLGYRRPVLILKGLSKETFLAIPLTTSLRDHPLRLSVGKIEDKEAHALLSQLRVIDRRRLVRKICYLEKEIFRNIRKTVRDML